MVQACTYVPKLASRRACLSLPFTFAAYLHATLVSKGRHADSSPPLPVFVSCGAGAQHVREKNSVLSALKYPIVSTALEFDFPATFIQGSARHLRRLELLGARLESLSHSLSSSTGLIDLSL
jgi:hypothetical protein